jgi:hypothetical protein
LIYITHANLQESKVTMSEKQSEKEGQATAPLKNNPPREKENVHARGVDPQRLHNGGTNGPGGDFGGPMPVYGQLPKTSHVGLSEVIKAKEEVVQ